MNQHAVQLIGPGKLVLTDTKEVPEPGPHQILCKVEGVGLCYSDLKLLSQFSAHVRKARIVSSTVAEMLASLPSYVPDEAPTVPGHEVVCRIAKTGEGVTRFRVGQRYLVQPDFRGLKTPKSNGAFGYNFEGGLQQYVLLDERIVVDKVTGESYLIAVDETLGTAQLALIEPWGCVESSYNAAERRIGLAGGRLLVVATPGHEANGVEQVFEGGPAAETVVRAGIEGLPDEHFDDILYFGADADTAAALGPKLAAGGILAIATAGTRFGRPVSVGVGRIHYGPTRWVGTRSASAIDAYRTIPKSGEIRTGDTVAVYGAGGPMGQMHVLRALSGGEAWRVVAIDVDTSRLASLEIKARRVAQAKFEAVAASDYQARAQTHSYAAIMAPVPELLSRALAQAKPATLINLFAGIPAPVCHPLDLDAYIDKGCFLFGTSGSRLRDMLDVLDSVKRGQLDTTISVDAVSGMAGAIEGLGLVERRALSGKIVVYPELTGLGLIKLSAMREKFPTVASKLSDGAWSKEAETELLRVARDAS